MSISRVDSRYRVGLPKGVRRIFKIEKGQMVLVIPSGNAVTVIPLDRDLDRALDELMGSVVLTRETKAKAAEYELKNVR